MLALRSTAAAAASSACPRRRPPSSGPGTPVGPSPSRRARRRTRTDRCARRSPGRAPARATCRPRCRRRSRRRQFARRRSCAASSGRSAPALGELGDAEVENLRLAATGDEEVGRLDVTMHDPGAWAASSASAICTPRSSTSSMASGPRADARLERLALEQLHHHELLAVVLADVVQRADVRMAQRRDDPGLAQEALHRLGDRSGVGGQQLDRHMPPEPRVLGLVDDAHARRCRAARRCDSGRWCGRSLV